MAQTHPLEFRNVSFSYGEKKVIDDLSLIVEKQKITCVRGKNGSGKSTLAKLSLGLIAPDDGNVLIFGFDTKRDDEKNYRPKISGVLQNPDSQIVNMSVFDDVMFTPKNLGSSKEDAILAANNAMKALCVEHLKDKSTYSLSGGEKQMVALVGAIAAGPDLLVLDEPTSMFDATASKHFFSWIKNYTSTGGTILIITHDNELFKISDKIVDLSC